MPYFYSYLISAWSFGLGWSAAAICLQNVSELRTRLSPARGVPPPPAWRILPTDAAASR